MADRSAEVRHPCGGGGQERVLFQEVAYGSFQTAEAEIEITAFHERLRKFMPQWIAFRREAVDLDASGVGEAKELCRFIEGFAGRIIQRPAQQCVAASATNLCQLRVAAAHQQGDVMGDLLTAEKG